MVGFGQVTKRSGRPWAEWSRGGTLKKYMKRSKQQDLPNLWLCCCRLTVQKRFVKKSRCTLRTCFLQSNTSSYFCRRFSVRKVLTRQAMFIESNIKKCSRNNFQPGREINSEIVWEFAVLIIQHAKNMLLIFRSSIAYLCVAFF